MSDQKRDTDPSTDDMSEEATILAANAGIIEEARSKHDSIAIFEAPVGFDGIVIVAAPSNPKVYQDFVNKVASDKTDKAVETLNFAMKCVVHPDRETVKAIFAKRGAFALKVAARAQELAGSETRELGKV